MSNTLLNKLKTIDNSRLDLYDILENKGVNVNRNMSLDNLIGSVGELSYYEEPEEDFDGVEKQESPVDYYKGDDDWKDTIDLHQIMEDDTESYQGKAIFLYRMSDNPEALKQTTEYALIGFNKFKFSDSTTLGNNSAHTWDSSQDIVIGNEHFRYIIGYTSDVKRSIVWSSEELVPEAVIYWQGEFKMICFEDSGIGRNTNSISQETYCIYTRPYNNSSNDLTLKWPTTNTSDPTRYPNDYIYFPYWDMNRMGCKAPKYFEVCENVQADAILGDANGRYSGTYTVYNNRTRTIIIDGTIIAEFRRAYAQNLEYQRISKTGFAKYLTLNIGLDYINDGRSPYTYYKGGSSGRVYAYNMHNGYTEIEQPLLGDTLELSGYKNKFKFNNVNNVAGAQYSYASDFDFCEVAQFNQNAFYKTSKCRFKIDKITRTVGNAAFFDSDGLPKTIIFEGDPTSTTRYELGLNAFYHTRVEILDMQKSNIDRTYMSSNENYVNEQPDNLKWNGTNGTYYGMIAKPFYGMNKLKVLKLPQYLTKMYNYFITDLPELETLILPDELLTIGEHAVRNNYKLKAITIPANVTSIGQYAFYNNKSLETVTMLCDNLTTIPDYCFANCSKLIDVQLSSRITTINQYAFNRCYFPDIILPDSVSTINQYAFADNDVLTSATFEGDTGRLLYLGTGAFANCINLTTVPTLENLTNCGYRIFLNCPNIHITLPNKKPSGYNGSNYYGLTFEATDSPYITIPADYKDTSGTISISGCRLNLSSFANYIQNLPTMNINYNLKLGCDYLMYRYNGAGSTSVGTYYTSVYEKISNWYVTFVDDKLVIVETAPSQGDVTTVAQYVASKNWTIT